MSQDQRLQEVVSKCNHHHHHQSLIHAPFYLEVVSKKLVTLSNMSVLQVVMENATRP